MDKVVLTSHQFPKVFGDGSGGDGSDRPRRSKRPNVYEINFNKDLYPRHYELMRNRSLHFRSRLFKRIGIHAGLGTYMKLSELCGKAFAELIRKDESFRYDNRGHSLGSKTNPKYLMRATIWGEEVRLIYDAYDMMVLTVFCKDDEGFTDGFTYHPDTIETPIVVEMDKLLPKEGNG